MPRHLISDAHEWINEIPTVPTYYLAKPQPRERAWDNQRGKKTLYEWECRRNRACRAFTSMLCLAPGAVQTINLPGGAIFIGALYMLEAILYIYMYVFIWCWQLENAYGAAEIVSNSWTIFFWSTVHICIMCPIASLFCCIGAESAGEPCFFWGNPWFPRVSPKTTISFINHQPICSTPISHIIYIYRIVW